MISLAGLALEVAMDAHSGQLDKGGNPYIQHPLAVASWMKTEREITVALLHDVVEDSDYTFETLMHMGFPDDIIEALKCLTHAPGEDYFDYIERVKQNELSIRVKLADLWHNSQLDRLHHEPTAKDLARIAKYTKAREILIQ